MNNENVSEWLQLADDDLYSAISVEKVSIIKPIIDIRKEIDKKI